MVWQKNHIANDKHTIREPEYEFASSLDTSAYSVPVSRTQISSTLTSGPLSMVNLSPNQFYPSSPGSASESAGTSRRWLEVQLGFGGVALYGNSSGIAPSFEMIGRDSQHAREVQDRLCRLS